MKKTLETLVVMAALCLGFGVVAVGGEKEGSVSGTWACVAHGADQGDIQYTFYLIEQQDKITGSFTDSDGKADITDGSFKDKKLELHFEAHGGVATITGTMAKKGEMSGDWTHSSGGQGTWECKAGSPDAASKK